ncbi:MAG: sigma 54-interacting transcriptional regulator [Clostridia bacterium]|nr:sigma 54-interacting transcriptional regulator [Clostridia bacterium]
MNKKIGILALNKELKNDIIELFENDVKEGNIIIEVLEPNKWIDQGLRLEKKGVKAIITRSGVFRDLKAVLKVPVVRLKVNTLDILNAIRKASKYSKDILFLLWNGIYFNYDEWKSFLNVDINIERFDETDGIELILKKYFNRKENIVVIGGGMGVSVAKQYDFDTVFLNATKESIYETVTYAKETVENLYKEKYKNEVLRTILDGVHDAVIAVDYNGKIELYNERAKELLKKDTSEVIERNLVDVFPQLEFIVQVLEDKVEMFNEIKFLRDLIIAVNVSIMNVDGQIEGVLCSFQDITKLEKLEKKIRYELNKKGLYAKYKFEDIIHVDPIMKETINKAKIIGKNDSTVIIYGESGTGKEMIAQSIHNISMRNDSPFVAVNCAAISETLLESELFGYEEGAFTGARKGGKLGLFELAHGGTIFLDEINSISLNLQAKLLRVLEEKEIMRIGSDYVIPLDVRIISAANEKLKREIENGSFRSDLFYRLNILELSIPALRKRKGDIIPLFEYLLTELSDEYEKISIDERTKQKLLNYHWPGNVRELRNIVQQYILFNRVDLDETQIVNSDDDIEEGVISKYIDLKQINNHFEKKIISMLLQQGLSKTDIAKTLGISRASLWNKMNS